jgi:arylsulfatase A-like enzyme
MGGAFFGKIRKGDWVLIEYFDGRDTELYNLANDPKEQNNLADTETAKRDELLNDLATWRTEVGAQMPVPR